MNWKYILKRNINLLSSAQIFNVSQRNILISLYEEKEVPWRIFFRTICIIWPKPHKLLLCYLRDSVPLKHLR